MWPHIPGGRYPFGGGVAGFSQSRFSSPQGLFEHSRLQTLLLAFCTQVSRAQGAEGLQGGHLKIAQIRSFHKFLHSYTRVSMKELVYDLGFEMDNFLLREWMLNQWVMIGKSRQVFTGLSDLKVKLPKFLWNYLIVMTLFEKYMNLSLIW